MGNRKKELCPVLEDIATSCPGCGKEAKNGKLCSVCQRQRVPKVVDRGVGRKTLTVATGLPVSEDYAHDSFPPKGDRRELFYWDFSPEEREERRLQERLQILAETTTVRRAVLVEIKGPNSCRNPTFQVVHEGVGVLA
ncbi:MAG: hypothetical protein WC757_02635 [Candidatus Paceibacterota bacterium]|jgi:hypothetical protein